jgi:hypothetical protein
VARGDLKNAGVLKRMARMMVRPALRYMETRIFDKFAKQNLLARDGAHPGPSSCGSHQKRGGGACG